jgi:hypothetical protein
VYTVAHWPLLAYSAFLTDRIQRYAMEGALRGVTACLLLVVLRSAVHPMMTTLLP